MVNIIELYGSYSSKYITCLFNSVSGKFVIKMLGNFFFTCNALLEYKNKEPLNVTKYINTGLTLFCSFFPCSLR